MGLTRALVIVNPAAGRGRGQRLWSQAVAAVGDLPPGVECVATERPGHARDLAATAVANGIERVIAVGGDGTVSEVAGGLLASEACLGIVPAGTGNDVAHTLGLPRQPGPALRVALTGASRTVDVGFVRSVERETAFVNVAGCGFDAEVIHRVNSGPRLGGTLPYALGVLRTLAAYRPQPMRFVADGRTFDRKVLCVAVAIGPTYGGGMRIAPGASIDDGWFDVCLIGDVTPRQIVALLPRLYRGTHVQHPKVEMLRCREVRVERLGSGAAECQSDGELVGSTPATFTIQQRALRCVVAP